MYGTPMPRCGAQPFDRTPIIGDSFQGQGGRSGSWRRIADSPIGPVIQKGRTTMARPLRKRTRVMSAGIGGVIHPETAWRLRIIARELGLTIDRACLYCVNSYAVENQISLDEIPDKDPDWILTRVEHPPRDHRSELD